METTTPGGQAPRELTDAERQLVVDNLPLIYFVAKRYQHIPPTSYEDLISRLYVRLCLCAMEFDPSRGYRPSSYLVKSLKGEIKNYFRDEPWVIKPPRSLRERSFAEAEIDEDTGLPLPRAPGENPDTLQSCVLPTSLDEPLGEEGDTRLDLLPGEERMEQRVIDRIAGPQLLREVFQALRPEERFILALQMRRKPLAELQERFELSRGGARRVWEELRGKVKRLYLLALEGDPLPLSEGSAELSHILASRFVPPKAGFLDIRKRVIETYGRL